MLQLFNHSNDETIHTGRFFAHGNSALFPIIMTESVGGGGGGGGKRKGNKEGRMLQLQQLVLHDHALPYVNFIWLTNPLHIHVFFTLLVNEPGSHAEREVHTDMTVPPEPVLLPSQLPFTCIIPIS